MKALVNPAYIKYWPGPYERADLLLEKLKRLEFKRSLTPGGGSNEAMIFGAMQNDSRGPLEKKDPIHVNLFFP